MSIPENIKKIRERFDLTQDELGEIAGVSGGAVSTWERGTAEPRMGAVQKIADQLNISKSEIVDDIPEHASESAAVRIHVYGSVPAGIPLEAVEDIVDWEDIPSEWIAGGKEFFGLKVSGDSMSPEYLDGDTIILRKQDDCENGDDCVVYVNGYDATFKRVIKKIDRIILQPLNSKYEPIICDYVGEEESVKIAGVVVELRRKKNK